MNEQNKELMEKYLDGNKEIQKPINYEEDQIVEIKEEKQENLLIKYLGEDIKSEEVNNQNLVISQIAESEPKEVVVIPPIITNKAVETDEKEINNNEKVVEISPVSDDTIIKIEENPIVIEDLETFQEESLEPITLDKEIDLPEPANLNEIVSNLPQPETNLYEAINEIAKEEAEQTQEPITEEPKKDNKVKRIIVAIFAILMLTGLSLIVALYLFNSNYKKIITRSFEHLSEYKSLFNNTFNLESNNFQLKGDLQLTTNNDSFDHLEDISFQYDMIKNKQDFQIDFNVLEKKEQLLGLDIIAKDYKGYILFKEVYENYIEIGEIQDTEEEISKEELNYAINKAYNIFIEKINKESFSSENAKIELNEKESQVRKTNLKLTEKEIYEITKEIVEEIKNDQQTKNIAKLFKDIKMNETEFSNSYIIYSVYTKGIMHKFVGSDLNIITEEEDYDQWYALDCDYYDDECNNNIPMKEVKYLIEYRENEKPTIDVYKNEKLLQQFKIIIKGNITTIEFNNLLDTMGTIIITKNNLSYKVSLDMSTNGYVYSFILDNQVEEVTKNKEYKINLDYQIKIKDNTDSVTINIKSNNNIKNTESEIKKPTDSIEYSEIDENKQQEITTKIMESLYAILGMDYVEHKEDDYYYEYN